MLKAGSWEVLSENPVPVGPLPKILVAVMGLKLQWGVALLCHLTAGTLGKSLKIWPLFPNEGNIPHSRMPFKLLSDI